MIDPRNLAAFARPKSPMSSFEDAEGAVAEVDRYSELRPALEQFAKEIDPSCDMLDPGALCDPGTEMDPTDVEILQQSIETFDPQLQQALRVAADINPTAAADIGMHLEHAGFTPDGDRFAGWLYRVGQHARVPAHESTDGIS